MIELTHAKEKAEKGEELAYFSFGPAAVLLFEKNKAAFAEAGGERLRFSREWLFSVKEESFTF